MKNSLKTESCSTANQTPLQPKPYSRALQHRETDAIATEPYSTANEDAIATSRAEKQYEASQEAGSRLKKIAISLFLTTFP